MSPVHYNHRHSLTLLSPSRINQPNVKYHHFYTKLKPNPTQPNQSLTCGFIKLSDRQSAPNWNIRCDDYLSLEIGH